MGKTVWENYVYQPLSSAIIHLNRENQKFQMFFGFLVTSDIALIGLTLQVYPEVTKDSIRGSIRYSTVKILLNQHNQ